MSKESTVKPVGRGSQSSECEEYSLLQCGVVYHTRSEECTAAVFWGKEQARYATSMK
jgi:hypothetical protein